MEFQNENEQIDVICKGCEKKCDEGFYHGELLYHEWARKDAYGLYTGLYCDKCYENNYPYRKDYYFDESYCGERMDEDY